MLEKMKRAFSNLSVLAGAYLPAGFKETLLMMAKEIDELRRELDRVKDELDHQNNRLNEIETEVFGDVAERKD